MMNETASVLGGGSLSIDAMSTKILTRLNKKPPRSERGQTLTSLPTFLTRRMLHPSAALRIHPLALVGLFVSKKVIVYNIARVRRRPSTSRCFF
jgi:hypothetical protein